MSDTLTYSGTLVTTTCWCGMRHAIPEELRRQQLREHDRGKSMSVYCPLGHQHAPCGESESEKLRKQLARANDELARQTAQSIQARDERDTAMRRLRATKGVVTITKKRIAKGACPCCKSKFADLAAHMAEKHPAYSHEKEEK